MNKIILMGRLVADPEQHTFSGENANTVANFRLAVDRRFAKKDDPNAVTADFFRCQAWGKTAETIMKFCKKGTKILVEGRVQLGSYEKDGQKFATTDVVVDNFEFAESKAASEGNASATPKNTADASFMNIPDTIGEEELPF